MHTDQLVLSLVPEGEKKVPSAGQEVGGDKHQWSFFIEMQVREVGACRGSQDTGKSGKVHAKMNLNNTAKQKQPQPKPQIKGSRKIDSSSLATLFAQQLSGCCLGDSGVQ